MLFKTDESSSSRQMEEPFKCGMPDLLIFYSIATVPYIWSFFLQPYSISRATYWAESKLRAAALAACRHQGTLAKACRMAPRKAVSSNGFMKKANAPPWRTVARAAGSSWPVMKMTRVCGDFAQRCASSSIPVI